MGVYVEAANQLTVAPLTETIEFESPFTLASEIETKTFDYISYIGTEDLDGKTVYVFENTAPEASVKYYVWADTGIIIKMEASTDTGAGTYYFKDLSLGTVTADDFEYPAGAEILDLSDFADIGSMGEFGDLGDLGIEVPELP